jgi:hypothetical protein
MQSGRPNESDISAWWRHHEINFSDLSCPVCKAEGDWAIGTTAVQQFVQVKCNHCGYVLLFDGSTVAGQVGTPVPDPYAPLPKKPKPKYREGKRK